MPEGDTIWRTAASLRRALVGKRVMEARPAGLASLGGTTVNAVDPVGKHIVIRFGNGYALHSHMRMNGVWHVYRPGEKWRRPEWQMKALLGVEDAAAVCFAAPVVELVRNVEERLGHLGPDILAEDWHVDDVIKRARQLDEVSIAELLLDQRVTAGIGNIYRCEALWQRRVNPWKKTEDLSDEELKGLLEAARNAMLSNLEARRRRISAVHGRARRPCPRCGTPIRSRLMGENPRVVYWCPTCQPAA